MAFPNMNGSAPLPKRTAPSVAGAEFSNPAADKLNQKRKKRSINPSLMGLKAATAAKPPMSEGVNIPGGL